MYVIIFWLIFLQNNIATIHNIHRRRSLFHHPNKFKLDLMLGLESTKISRFIPANTSNVSLEGYNVSPDLSMETAILIKDNLGHFCKDSVSVREKEFESLNKKYNLLLFIWTSK